MDAWSLSIVMPVYGNLVYTKAIVEYFSRSIVLEAKWELIIVDDASQDETGKFLQTICDHRIKIVTNEDNRGFAFSCNRGAMIARSEMILFLNNDVSFTQEDWLSNMLKCFHSIEDVGCLGNVQILPDGMPDHYGLCVDKNGFISHMIVPGVLEGVQIASVFAVTGACLMCEKNSFEKVGGFDEVYVNGGEDVDFCLKMRLLRRENYVALNSIIVHHKGKSRKINSVRDDKNSFLLYTRWRSEITLELENVLRAAKPNLESELRRSGLIDDKTEIVCKKSELPVIVSRSLIARQFERWGRLIMKKEALLSPFIDVKRIGRRIVEIRFIQLEFVKNIYVSGWLEGCGKSIVTIEVAGVLMKRQIVEKSFNVGVDNVIFNVSSTNVIRISVSRKCSSRLWIWPLLSRARIDRLIIDDRVVTV